MTAASSTLGTWGHVRENLGSDNLDRRGSLKRRVRPALAESVRTTCETLEARWLMSVIPSPVDVLHLENVRDPSGNANRGDSSSPVIAMDPINPKHLVAAYTIVGVNSLTNQDVFVHLAYSTDGGQTWADQAVPGNIHDPSSTTATTVYGQASDPSVSFDRHGNFYLVYNQHTADYARGAIVLNEFSFLDAPDNTGLAWNLPIYQWNGADAAISPTFIVDNTLPSYTDPDTGATVTNPTAGNLYVAWATNLTNATDTTDGYHYQVNYFNPNAIMMMVANPVNNVTTSSGNVEPRFSNPFFVNANGYGSKTDSAKAYERDSHPKLVVSQGDVAGHVTPGQVSVVWDDWNTSGPARVTDTTAQYDLIRSGVVLPGTTATVEDLNTGLQIDDAVQIASDSPDVPSVTTATLNVHITDPTFTKLGNLTVSLAIGGTTTAVDLSQYKIELIDPSGTRSIVLFYNRTDSSGVANTAVGIAGGAMGVLNGNVLFTTFDDNAVRPIDDGSATAPFIGSFQVEQSQQLPNTTLTLASIFGGMTLAQINGTWKLRITDYRSGPTVADAAIPPTLEAWKLGFTTGSSLKLRPNEMQPHDRAVASSTVLGPANATSPDNYARGTNLSPTGIGSNAVIASDNTLGSYSRYQGVLYVAYVDRSRATGNPADNTDVWIITSTDGGLTWSNAVRVNDDDALRDGFSSANPTTVNNSGRAQFLPAIAVDQTTGTVAVTFLDARNDASRDRVATYFAASIDGAQTWSQNAYLNTPNAVTDATNLQTVNLGPIPDNLSPGAAVRETSIGFGHTQGLVVYGGHVVSIWAGNLNGGPGDGDYHLGILSTLASITAGPRVVSSTMGQVGLPGDMLNPPGCEKPELRYFELEFDRWVDLDSFVLSGDGQNVHLVYREPGVSGNADGVEVPLGSIAALDGVVIGGKTVGTRFRIALQVPWDDVGTYSYYIIPTVSDLIRKVSPLSYIQAPISYSADLTLPVAVPSVGTGSNGSPDDNTWSVIKIQGFPDAQKIVSVSVRLRMDHTANVDLRIKLISPDGTEVVLVDPGSASGRNFGTGTGAAIRYTVFADGASPLSAGSGPYSGAFAPDNPLSAFAGESLSGRWRLVITDVDGLPPPQGDSGILYNWGIDFTTVIVSPATGNYLDQNANGTPGEQPISGHTTHGAKVNPTATVGDLYATPMPTTETAWDGKNLHAPYATDTLPLIIAGPHVVTSRTYEAQGANTNVPLVDAKAPPVVSVLTPGHTESTITVGGDTTARVTKVVVAVDIRHAAVQTLTLRLRWTNPDDPSDTKVITLVRADTSLQADRDDFTGTVFDDTASVLISSAITAGDAPFTGAYRPVESLSAFIGNSLAGCWTLEVDDVTPAYNGPDAEIVGWSITADSTPVAQDGGTDNIHITFDRDMDPSSLNGSSVLRMVGPNGEIAGPFTITPDPYFDPYNPDPHPWEPRTYKISFTKQTASGSYSLVLAPTIKSADGDFIDANLDAGVDALRGFGAYTIPMNYTTSTPVTIDADPWGTAVSTSTITIDDTYTIQGGVSVRFNATFLNDSLLTAYLISPLGTRIKLFDRVGGTRANFTNTLFDDNASTPISNGLGSFFGRFAPQEPLSQLVGCEDLQGTWTLEVINHSTTGVTGTITGWSIEFGKPQAGTGLGDAVADRTTVPFKIFNLGLNVPGSTSSWTSVTSSGTVLNDPITGTSTTVVGRITSIAVDPSDPSGNTVFVTTPSGGVWKTTNFLTTSPAGPTYASLTDFGPIGGMHVASVALIGRNGDPNQTIVFAMTGDPDTGQAGVGLLRSMDGGLTWTLLDSITNFDAVTGLQIPTAQRAHDFVGTVGYKVIADPMRTPTGDYILYAAFSGNDTVNGVYRSTDTGRTWTRVLVGNATDVILDMNSGPKDAFNNPTGNLQILYAGIAGQGIFMTPNRGQSWNLLSPLGFDGSVRDGSVNNPPPLELTETPDPNLNKGRIVLAMPNIVGADAIARSYHEGWVYAAVVKTAPVGTTRSGVVDGLYMTKDFGQNWTRVDLNMLDAVDTYGVVPTNSQDSSTRDFTPSSGRNAQEGNYALTLAVDPFDPNVVYFGGSGWGTQFGPSVIRVDTTGISDAHAFYMRNDSDDNLFRTDVDNEETVTLKNWLTDRGPQNPVNTPYINLVNNPGTGNRPGSTFYMYNVDEVTNSGRGAKWIGIDDLLDLPSFNGFASPVHNVVVTVDPVTGKTRITVSTDTGIYTTVYDGDGQAATGVGNTITPIGSRGGDLAVNEMIYGAVQPSVGAGLANEIAGALFYASSKTTGVSWSDPNILTNGDTTSVIPQQPSSSGGIATDQTGTGNVYYTLDPYRASAFSRFFVVNGVAQTTGLFNSNTAGNHTRDPQWPDDFAPNFAVNSVNGDQIVVSSAAGRIYATTNRGFSWFVIGDPTALDGTYAPALAYGAPDPSATVIGNDATNLRVYAGTTGGHIFMTVDTLGAGTGGWRDISTGLDGSAVQSIVTDPTRGSHALYAVTKAGIYFLADSTVANPTWVRINGNIATLTRDPFKNPDLTENALSSTGLTSIVADWRYVLPGLNGTTFPLLYVGGEAGVFRSLDNGTTWTLFPTASEGADVEGGFLPNVKVTDLDLGIGNVNPTTGFTNVSTGPSVLLATTDGRGQFAIRVAPVLVGTTAFGPNDDLGQRTITGRSQASAYGNVVTINIYDCATPDPSHLVGTGTTDFQGKFTISLTCPIRGHSVIVQAVDAAGVAGPIVTLWVPPDSPPAPTLDPASNSGSTDDNQTNVRKPTIIGTADPGNTVLVFVDDVSVGTVTAGDDGTWSFALPYNLTDGFHTFAIIQRNAQNLNSAFSRSLVIEVDGTGPTGAGLAIPPATSTVSTGDIPLATFRDAHQVVSATIDWGDGTPATVVTNDHPANGATFNVVSSHTYATVGNYTITVTAIDDFDNVSGAVTTTATVSAPIYTFTLIPQSPTGLEEGKTFSDVQIAIITDGKTSPAHTPDDLTAVVDWGDGTTSIITGTASAAGQIVAAAGGFKVLGSHTYIDNRADLSPYVVTVTVTTADGKIAQVVSSLDAVNVAPTASLTPPADIYVGQSTTVTITATDPSTADTAAGFTYLVDWGDGTTETVNPSANNGTGVTLTHTFATVGTMTITVTATDKDGGSKTITQTLTVKALPILSAAAVNGNPSRSDISQITFNITDTDLVGGVGLSNLKLYYNGDGVHAIPMDGALLTFDPASGDGSLDLRNLTTPLRDGDYQLHITVAGKLFVVRFFKLQGDVNGDGLVDAKDLGIINRFRGKSVIDPGVNAAADLNHDGIINAADANLYNKLKGRRASGGNATLTLKTGKASRPPKLDFGKVALNSNGGYIDLVIRNINPNLSPLNIGKLTMAGSGFAYALADLPWGPASANAVTTISPGKSMTVRIYLKSTTKAKNLTGKLMFSFATSASRDYKDVSVPIKASVVATGVLKAKLLAKHLKKKH